jgi:hypothetical protein
MEVEFAPVHFYNVGAGATVYYYCGTTGWGPTYGSLPTVMLFAPIAPGSAGVKPGGFGFTLLPCLTNQSGELTTHLDQHPARRLRQFCRSRMGESPAPLLSRALGLKAPGKMASMKLQHVIL